MRKYLLFILIISQSLHSFSEGMAPFDIKVIYQEQLNQNNEILLTAMYHFNEDITIGT